MSGFFLFALLLAQQTEPDAPPPVDAPDAETQPANPDASAEPAPPTVPDEAPPPEETSTPVVETPAPPPAQQPAAVEPAPAPQPNVTTSNTSRLLGTALTAGTMTVGVPLALACGLAAAMPLSCLCAASWLWLSSSGGTRPSLRWYDAVQLAALFSPVLLLAGCLAAPLGAPLALVSSALGVMAPRKPSLERLRASAAAAIPGAALAVVPAAATAGSLLSGAVLLTSLVTFWLTYSPSLGPEFPTAPRIWHQVNNVACCCLGVSLLTTPVLALAAPASTVGACGGFAWTAWRAGKTRAGLDCPQDAPCTNGGDP